MYNYVMTLDFEARRHEMVRSQIVDRGINDQRVIDAMMRVPRERFVPEQERIRAYADGPLPIGSGQTISQPYMVAYMTELLELTGNERVLEIGTGSGYQTAVLAELCREVFTMERIPELASRARERLSVDQGYSHIRFRTGDGKAGWPEAAPFAAIMLTAAPEEIPPLLETQMADPGILVAPAGRGIQRICRIRLRNGQRSVESLIHVAFVPCI